MEIHKIRPDNRERRKEVGRVFFDLSKYLLTTVAIGSLLSKEVDFVTAAVAVSASFLLLTLAYHITPLDKED